MRKMYTMETLRALVSTYVLKAHQAGDFEITRENIAGLVDKIGKIVMIPQNFNDKLPELEGEALMFGKTIEETSEDLILPVDFDSEGTTALKPEDPTYRKPSYSKSLGVKTFKTTKRKNNLNRACLNEGNYAELINAITKKLYDSQASFRYATKRQLIGNMASKAIEAQSTATAFQTKKAYAIGEYVKNSADETRAVVFKAIPSNNSDDFATCISNGVLVALDLVKEIAIPVDTTTGEAFIKQLKADIEDASDESDGHSLNGGTLGAAEGLKLYVKHGVMPSIEVDTIAGAFNKESLSVPAEIKVIKDFGNLDSNVYAILVDPRGIKLHPTWIDADDDKNGEGAFTNYYLHTENTGFISKNTYIRVYKVGA